MGGSGSVPLPRYSCCIRQQNPNRCKENHSSTPKIKGHKRNLSAAFNMADIAKDFNVDQIDINRATEEELMTLPGINRNTAKNIVDYRRQIGGFKKVEDLALVSGVGANKLTNIRLEICVGRKKSSQSSSPNSSKVDLSMQDDVSRASSKSQVRQNGSYSKININTGNVFHLMKVKGLTQNLAENIVAYRDRKGPFQNLDDLVKVKGIKPAMLSALRPYLSLYELNPSRMDGVFLNGSVPGSNPGQQVGGYHGNRQYGHARSHSQVPMSTTTAPSRSAKAVSMFGSQEDLISLYGPLARKSFRSVRRPVLFRKNNRPILRLASWNIQDCGLDKVDNPGVKEVVAMTVLENGLSIVGVQDLRHPDALSKLCDELNHPTIPNVKKWSQPSGNWQSMTSKSVGGASQGYVGFLYDVSRGIECKSLEVLETSENHGKILDRRPCKAIFKVQDWEVAVVCVDWEPHQPDTVLDDVLDAVDEQTQDNKDVIVLGSFDLESSAKEFDVIRHKGYESVLVNDKYTNISSRNPEGTKCTCNIWISRNTSRLYTEQHGVVRDGLTSPWIPDGWGWGGVISSHCPLWAEFYIDVPVVPQPVAPPVTFTAADTEDDEDDFVDASDRVLL